MEKEFSEEVFKIAMENLVLFARSYDRILKDDIFQKDIIVNY